MVDRVPYLAAVRKAVKLYFVIVQLDRKIQKPFGKLGFPDQVGECQIR
jgi:hypothetical protein